MPDVRPELVCKALYYKLGSLFFCCDFKPGHFHAAFVVVLARPEPLLVWTANDHEHCAVLPICESVALAGAGVCDFDRAFAGGTFCDLEALTEVYLHILLNQTLKLRRWCVDLHGERLA